MPKTALVLTHDDDLARGEHMVGLLRATLEARGYDVVARSFMAGQDMPPPVEVDAVLPLGSEAAAYDDSLPWLAAEISYLKAAIAADVPVMGICFGAQLLARVLGGTVKAGEQPEVGFITIDSDAPELVPPGPWVSSHYDVIEPPRGARVLARTPLAVQAFVYKQHVGLQFHPEVTGDVIRAWEGRRAAGLEPGDRQLDTWLDPDAVSRQVEAGLEDGMRRCQLIVDAFAAGLYAQAAAVAAGSH